MGDFLSATPTRRRLDYLTSGGGAPDKTGPRSQEHGGGPARPLGKGSIERIGSQTSLRVAPAFTSKIVSFS